MQTEGRGFIVWLTGMSGAGKSTLARALREQLAPLRPVELLDGDEVRRLAAEDSIPFVEVYARACLDSLVRRDVKGLYKKALAGEIPHFTGISDPYEPPACPEVVVRTDEETVEAARDGILEALRVRGLFPPNPVRAR